MKSTFDKNSTATYTPEMICSNLATRYHRKRMMFRDKLPKKKLAQVTSEHLKQRPIRVKNTAN